MEQKDVISAALHASASPRRQFSQIITCGIAPIVSSARMELLADSNAISVCFVADRDGRRREG